MKCLHLLWFWMIKKNQINFPVFFMMFKCGVIICFNDLMCPCKMSNNKKPVSLNYASNKKDILKQKYVFGAKKKKKKKTVVCVCNVHTTPNRTQKHCIYSLQPTLFTRIYIQQDCVTARTVHSPLYPNLLFLSLLFIYTP